MPHGSNLKKGLFWLTVRGYTWWRRYGDQEVEATGHVVSVVWKWGDEFVQDPPVRADFPSGSILIDKPTGVFP